MGDTDKEKDDKHADIVDAIEQQFTALGIDTGSTEATTIADALMPIIYGDEPTTPVDPRCVATHEEEGLTVRCQHNTHGDKGYHHFEVKWVSDEVVAEVNEEAP